MKSKLILGFILGIVTIVSLSFQSNGGSSGSDRLYYTEFKNVDGNMVFINLELGIVRISPLVNNPRVTRISYLNGLFDDIPLSYEKVKNQIQKEMVK